MNTLSIPDLEQTVDVLRAVGGALRMRDDNEHLTVAESLAAAGGFLCGALQGKATDKDVDRMANNVQTFTQGLRAGLKARADGDTVPWSEVKKELGIKTGVFRTDSEPEGSEGCGEASGLAEVAAKSSIEVDEDGWPKSIWEGVPPEERLAKLRDIVETAVKEGADPYVQVGRQLLWPDLDAALSDVEWKAKHPNMRQHAKEFCYGASFGGESGEIVKLVGEALFVADDTDAEKKPKKKAKPRRRLHRATRS